MEDETLQKTTSEQKLKSREFLQMADLLVKELIPPIPDI